MGNSGLPPFLLVVVAAWLNRTGVTSFVVLWQRFFPRVPGGISRQERAQTQKQQN
jgi:hypothetical protein